MCAAARIAGGTVPSALGGVARTTSFTPATRAGMAVIRTVDGYAARPPGAYSHARADLLHGHPLLRELRQVEPPARPRRVQPRRGVEPLNRQRTPPRAAAQPSPAPHRCASSGSPGWR